MVFVELLHDVRPGRFETAEEDGAEDARGAPGEPLVHLVDGLKRVALRHGQPIDGDDRKGLFDGARYFGVIHLSIQFAGYRPIAGAVREGVLPRGLAPAKLAQRWVALAYL